ncbi:hypothetical protein IFM89_008340 [Coptis chinensis]|uniref:Uncharacterized protein n=1 Tax=Coptis chinensis TaxID=261450 RepID=A0A835LYZ0_9MAGN|nr:hypothetical protein IFM89_008340 [Coptis chinensis]
MRSLGTEGRKKIVITQGSIHGFNERVNAEELTNFLANEMGVVLRCRLKTSWTPRESYPNFNVTDTESIQRADDYEKVAPHSFVHFASFEATTTTLKAGGRSELVFNKKPLVLNLGPGNSLQRTTYLCKLSDVGVEIGTPVGRDEFLIGWQGPKTGVDFLVDLFDGTCKFLFTRETAFSFKGTTKLAVIKCNFKVEFLVRDITDIKRYNDMSSLVVLFHLDSSPHLFYRTAEDDDVYEPSRPFVLLNEDDPWIRTTDFTLGGVIGLCNSYRICMSPCFGVILEKTLNYLKQLAI